VKVALVGLRAPEFVSNVSFRVQSLGIYSTEMRFSTVGVHAKFSFANVVHKILCELCTSGSCVSFCRDKFPSCWLHLA
jgi:hypothetical protein